MKQIISLTIYESNNLFVFKENVFDSNIYLAQRYFVWIIKCHLIQINLLFE